MKRDNQDDEGVGSPEMLKSCWGKEKETGKIEYGGRTWN